MVLTRKLFVSTSLALAGCGTFNGEEPEAPQLGGAAAGAALGAAVSGGVLVPAAGAVGGAVAAEEAAEGDGLFAEGEQAAPRAVQEPQIEAIPLAEAEGQAAAGGTAAPDQQYPEGAMSAQLISKVQEQLNEMGYDAGPVDGVWGPLTSRGVRNFQQAQPELEATGELTAQTLDALGIAADDGGSASAGAGAPKQ